MIKLSDLHVEFLRNLTSDQITKEEVTSVLNFRGFEAPGHRVLPHKAVDFRFTLQQEEDSCLSLSFLCFNGRFMHRYEFLLQTNPPITDETRHAIRDTLGMEGYHPVDPNFNEAWISEYKQLSDVPVLMGGYELETRHHWARDKPFRDISMCHEEGSMQQLEFLLNTTIQEIAKQIDLQRDRGR